MKMAVIGLKLAVILCTAVLVIGWAANGESQELKGREPNAAEALAEIRNLINQLNTLERYPGAGTSTTTSTFPSTTVPGGSSYVGSTAQKLLEKIYGLVPYIETDEFQVKEIRWTVGWSTNMEITMERRPRVKK